MLQDDFLHFPKKGEGQNEKQEPKEEKEKSVLPDILTSTLCEWLQSEARTIS